MKSSIKLSALGSALALAGIFMVGGVAQADTVTATLGLVSGKSGTINTNQGDGGAGLFSSPVQDGTFTGNLMPVDQSFVAFCLQPQENLDNSVTYTVAALKDAPVTQPGSTMGPAGQAAMEILLGNVYPMFGAGTVQNATVAGITVQQTFLALQSAIWEIANERTQSAGSYSVSVNSGSFFLDSGSNANVVAQANAWLVNLTSNSWKANQLNNLVALTHPTAQDFVAQVVPIPAAAWLFGSALMGVVALGRRRMKNGAQV